MAVAYHFSLPLVLVTAAALAACGGGQPATVSAAAPSAMPVSIVEARTADVSLRNEWVGTLDGYVNAQIQPQVSGYLVRQNYREGQVVAKGQVLFQIDQRPFQAALNQAKGQIGQAEGQTAQAEGQLAQAEAQLKLAQINFDRDAPLAAQRAIAQSQLDNEKQQLDQAEANVRTAKGAIAAGRAGIATARANAALTLSLADGAVFPHPGHIDFVDRQMNQQTGAIRIAASFANPGNVLRPGQFARVSAATRVVHDALLVPQAAVTDLQGIKQVYTVAANGTAHVVNVSLGPQYGSDWIVTSGLSPGAKIITNNLQKLREGAPVAPQTVQSQGN